ncbi:MAG: FAD-linked oxidase C-terminal domain-containing protein [Acidimicrobiales bacterium]
MSAFELVPEIGVARVIERYSAVRPLESRAEWYVILRYSGPTGTAADELAAPLQLASERGYIADAVMATSSSEEDNLWRIRDELPPPRIFDGYLVKYDLCQNCSIWIGPFQATSLD